MRLYVSSTVGYPAGSRLESGVPEACLISGSRSKGVSQTYPQSRAKRGDVPEATRCMTQTSGASEARKHFWPKGCGKEKARGQASGIHTLGYNTGRGQLQEDSLSSHRRKDVSKTGNQAIPRGGRSPHSCFSLLCGRSSCPSEKTEDCCRCEGPPPEGCPPPPYCCGTGNAAHGARG
jgi:hypothetical protein